MARLANFRWGWLLLPFGLLRRDWFICYLAGTLVVVLGVAFGRGYLANPVGSPPASFIDSFGRWDGTYYVGIARNGYDLRRDPFTQRVQQSSIHFWPLFPLAGRAVTALTGLAPEYSLVLVANLCFAAALALLGRYVGLRAGPGGAGARTAALLAVAFLPAGLFFRMAYTESLFLLLCLAQLHLVERRANPLAVAALAGLAILTRPTGVALLLPLVVSLFERGYNRWRLAGWLGICLPLALSGWVAFLFYCDRTFGDPLVAIRDRTELWRMRDRIALDDKVARLLSLEPVWEIFLPGTQSYWADYCPFKEASPYRQVLFVLYPLNPIYFLGGLALLGVGALRGWLNRAEVLLALALLLIPYLTQGYETKMVSLARYTSVAVPLYLVLGRLLARVPPAPAGAAVALAGLFLAAFAGEFASGYISYWTI
jgi:hypothetical protein